MLVIRGGPDSLVKLEQHARRTSRAYSLDGLPVLGVSVFLALDPSGDASLDGILAARMNTYRVVRTTDAASVTRAGFGLLPTFGRPHFTLTLPDLERSALEALANALGPAQTSPYHVARRRR